MPSSQRRRAFPRDTGTTFRIFIFTTYSIMLPESLSGGVVRIEIPMDKSCVSPTTCPNIVERRCPVSPFYQRVGARSHSVGDRRQPTALAVPKVFEIRQNAFLTSVKTNRPPCPLPCSSTYETDSSSFRRIKIFRTVRIIQRHSVHSSLFILYTRLFCILLTVIFFLVTIR